MAVIVTPKGPASFEIKQRERSFQDRGTSSLRLAEQ